ncbi:MAG: hypothetical protein ACI85O_002652 [Saprospiraceae bacterium]|jgi:hypothetical protein
MKNTLFLFFTLLFCVQLSAQDTLYIKGKRAPLLAEIVKVKNKVILYKKYQGRSDRTLEISRDRVLHFGLQPSPKQIISEQEELQGLKEDFVRKPNTVYMSTRGILGLSTLGLYYDRSIFTNTDGNMNLGILVGGGLTNAGETDVKNNPNGQYVELGGRAEFGRQRVFFQTGLNTRYVSETTVEEEMSSAIHLGIPFGVTFRNNRGAYLTGGGEFSSLNWAQPLLKLALGWSF